MATTIEVVQRYAAAEVKTAPVGSTSVMRHGRRPFQARPMFWRMNDIPIAVISGASRGAFRSGL